MTDEKRKKLAHLAKHLGVAGHRLATALECSDGGVHQKDLIKMVHQKLNEAIVALVDVSFTGDAQNRVAELMEDLQEFSFSEGEFNTCLIMAGHKPTDDFAKAKAEAMMG